jgi:putative flippase GtrA
MTEAVQADRAARDSNDAPSSWILFRLRRTTMLRVLRCLCVSVGTTVLSAVALVILAVGFGIPAGTASLIANGCGIPASYLGNRHWVWRRSGRGDLAREVVPFWILSLAGLVVSTLFVSYVGTITAAVPAAGRAIALPAANIGVFAALWIVQFALLDRVIFRNRTQANFFVS